MDKRKKYDFDKLTDRHGTNCLKYDFAVERGKPENILPLWVADMDFVRFEQQVKEKKVKLFLLCNPHNPVGRVWTKEELETVGRICLENGVIVLSVEIHHDFVYPGHKQTVFATLSSAIQNITISCTAPSKTFNLAGLQVSNIWIPNADMRRRFQKEIARTGYSQLNTMGLIACESAYAYARDWLEQLSEYLKGNLDFVRNYLQKKIPQIRLIEPEGT